MVRQMDQSSGASFKFVDGPLVDTLVSTTQRSVESMFSNARLEVCTHTHTHTHTTHVG